MKEIEKYIDPQFCGGFEQLNEHLATHSRTTEQIS